MFIFQSLILGIVQGLTEFLPVSSSGHLVLIPNLFGWDYQSLAFDTTLHLGTAAALIIYFRKDLVDLLKNINLILKIVVGSIPAVFLGLFFENAFEFYFRGVFFVIIFLLFGSLIMAAAEYFYTKKWHEERIDNFENLSYLKVFMIGLFQALALFPGVSRSGASISAGMFAGLKREVSAKFSFLLSVPVVVGAGFYKLIFSASTIVLDINFFLGFLASFISGIFVINFLLKFLKTNSMWVFIVYRLVLILVLGLLFLQV